MECFFRGVDGEWCVTELNEDDWHAGRACVRQQCWALGHRLAAQPPLLRVFGQFAGKKPGVLCLNRCCFGCCALLWVVCQYAGACQCSVGAYFRNVEYGSVLVKQYSVGSCYVAEIMVAESFYVQRRPIALHYGSLARVHFHGPGDVCA